jgi:hypothetical protein
MKYQTEHPEWVSFYPKYHSGFYLGKAGYFDERPEINTSITQLLVLFILPFLLLQSLWFLFLIPFLIFGWGSLYIHLPIKTGIQDCESATWGINYHGNKLWFYIGGGGNFEGGRKWKTITMPWDMTWVRTSILLKNNDWFHETKNNRRSWNDDKDGKIVGSYGWLKINKWQEIHPYIDSYDNTVVNATISIEEREWRPLWFQWTKIFAKIHKDIKVEFDKEVGKEKGSWKGGTIGCGYRLLPEETPYEGLKRMEKEEKF